MRVLVAGNHSSLKTIVKRKLHSMNRFELINEACSGETAWDLIQSINYEIVICDSTLSDMSGLNLIKKCRKSEKYRFLPFVMMGSENDGSTMASALGEWEASDYIIKPFSLGTLESRITRTLVRIDCVDERLYKQIRLLKDRGHVGDALTLINREELLSKLNMARWINLRGECLAMAGEDYDAIASFERAIEMCDILISAYKNCANVNIKMGKVDNALTLLKTAEIISPTDDERSLQLGDLLLKRGKLDECRIHFAKVRSRYTIYNNTLYIDRKIASVFSQNDIHTDAEAIYNDILERDPNIDDYNMLGIIFRQQYKYKEAEECYRKALIEYPDHPTIYYNLAVLSLAQNNRFAARKYVLKALDFDPNHEHALRLLQKIRKGSL
jgi:tetratricopeptide (TPR) repeat protein